MTPSLVAALRATRFALLAVFALLLAGCVINSSAELVADAEAVDVLPASFYAFPFPEGEDTREYAGDEPQAFTRVGHTYVGAGEQMSLRFVPVAGAADTYLLAVMDGDQNLYGVARYRGDGVLSIAILLTDDDPAARIEAEKAAGTPGLGAVTADASGITVADRAALDQLIRMHIEGRLPMESVVAWLGDGPGAQKPARIVRDGDFWKPAN